LSESNPGGTVSALPDVFFERFTAWKGTVPS